MRPLTILLVEDNEDDIYLTRRVITRSCPACEVIIKRDGAEAMAFFEEKVETQQNPHLIFLDLNLPKVHGLAIIRTVRSLASYAGSRLIVLSSSDYEKDKHECLSSGADLYIPKPLTTSTFQEIMKQLTPALAAG